MRGTLYVIGTPIGNLQDLSPRAQGTLRSVDVLYCEDTRVTLKLLNHFSITKRIEPLSDDSPAHKWIEAIEMVNQGMSIGYVSDAGMPGLSDPGRRLVREAWKAGITPIVVPGPSSVGTLIAACPFVQNSFRFVGFPPRKPNALKEFATGIAASADPVFFFESPHRAIPTLDILCPGLEPLREVLIGREMTKMFEEFRLFEAKDWETVKEGLKAVGEYTIGVGPRLSQPEKPGNATVTEALARMEKSGYSKRDAVKAVSIVLDMNANDVKKLAYD